MSIFWYNLLWGILLILVLISLVFLILLTTASMMDGTCKKSESQESYSSGIARCRYQGQTPILTCSYHAFKDDDERQQSFVV